MIVDTDRRPGVVNELAERLEVLRVEVKRSKVGISHVDGERVSLFVLESAGKLKISFGSRLIHNHDEPFDFPRIVGDIMGFVERCKKLKKRKDQAKALQEQADALCKEMSLPSWIHVHGIEGKFYITFNDLDDIQQVKRLLDKVVGT